MSKKYTNFNILPDMPGVNTSYGKFLGFIAFL